MIKLRTTAAAYLKNGEDYLLMRRSMERKFAPGIWAGVGGHLEPDEINSPEEACLREIFEETQISKSNIHNLKLKYIILRRSKDEIRIQYIYFGETSTRHFVNTDEGELFWISKEALLNRELSATTRMTFEHYFEYGGKTEDVLVGTVSAINHRPVMNWNPVQDWEGLK